MLNAGHKKTLCRKVLPEIFPGLTGEEELPGRIPGLKTHKKGVCMQVVP
jgi:hypothetical protein